MDLIRPVTKRKKTRSLLPDADHGRRPIPSHKAARVAGTTGLAATFSTGAAAEVLQTRNPQLLMTPTDSQVIVISHTLILCWKQHTRPPIQHMDGIRPTSKAKAKAKAKTDVPLLESEEEPVRTQTVQGPTSVAQGESLSFRKIWHTTSTDSA